MPICSIEGCNKESFARSWCMMHYSRFMRHGDVNYQRKFKKDEPCIVEGCERTNKCGGYCSTHYAKIKRSGTLARIRETEEFKRRNSESRKTPLTLLDSTPDAGSGRRGYLAVNIINDIKNKARNRGIKWDLDPIDVYYMIIGQCTYCGHKPDWPKTRIGLDRVDNTKSYTKDNCVGCCFRCNTLKGSSSVAEFYNHVKAIDTYLKSKTND